MTRPTCKTNVVQFVNIRHPLRVFDDATSAQFNELFSDFDSMSDFLIIITEEDHLKQLLKTLPHQFWCPVLSTPMSIITEEDHLKQLLKTLPHQFWCPVLSTPMSRSHAYTLHLTFYTLIRGKPVSGYRGAKCTRANTH